MNVSVTEFLNSISKLRERIQTGHVSRNWPLIIVFVRFTFAIIAQALVAGFFKLSGYADPWQAAAP